MGRWWRWLGLFPVLGWIMWGSDVGGVPGSRSTPASMAMPIVHNLSPGRFLKPPSPPLWQGFGFGYAHLQESPLPLGVGAGNADLASGPWILTEWQPSWHGAWLSTFLPNGSNASKVPYLYGYVVGGMAKAEAGLVDCNVGSPNLCEQGALFIRHHRRRLTDRYRQVAHTLAQTWGTSRPLLFHVEPDFFQYAQTFDTAQQQPLSFAEAQSLLNIWIQVIQEALPNALIVLDISPWNPNLAGWIRGIHMKKVSFVGLVGKVFPAGDEPIDLYRYEEIHAITGKPIIVNTAYGPGGRSNGYQRAWDFPPNLRRLAAAGVIAVIQPTEDQDHYEQVIATWRLTQGKDR